MANDQLHQRERDGGASADRASAAASVGKRPLLGAALEFLVQRKPSESTAPAEAPAEAKPVECAKCASKATETEPAAAGGGCAHSPNEVCASCSGKQARPAEQARPVEQAGCAHSPFEACATCSAKPAETKSCAHSPFEACTACAAKPRQARPARQAIPREGGEGQQAVKGGGGAGGADAEGGEGGEVQVGGDCEPCKAGEVFARALVQRTQMPAEGQRPLEAGWWTGSWYTSSNTIMCDGSGALTIHEATNYPYGVQECTVKHEAVHKADWYARYGKDVCKGRKTGDLPHFDPPGKEAYSAFLKASECKAWKVGESCRKEKLNACKDDTCKTEVQGHVDWAATNVKKYCG